MNVLLGLAGGEESMKTLRQTIDRTQSVGDDLTIAVVEKPGVERSPSAVRDRAEALLEEAGIEAEVHLLDGDPASSLVDFAEEGSFDQLVIGGGTVSQLGKIHLGEITEYVLLNAPITVKLVR